MASILLGFGFTPSSLIIWPKYATSCLKNWHLSACSCRLASLNLCISLSIFILCSSNDRK